MGWRCTPRYFIYEAAWRLTRIADGFSGEDEIRRIRELLPVSTPACVTRHLPKIWPVTPGNNSPARWCGITGPF